MSQEMNIENRNIKEKLEQKIEELKKNIDGQKIQIEDKEKEIQILNNEHKDELFKKDEKIRQLKRKIDEMSSQFADMLKVNIYSYLIDWLNKCLIVSGYCFKDDKTLTAIDIQHKLYST